MKDILRCLILPLVQKSLIVPSAAVAEVTSFGEIQPLANVPSWVLGTFDWHEQKIPLIALENFDSACEDSKNNNVHIAIFNRIVDTPLEFFGLRLNQIPRMYRVSAKDLTDATKSIWPYLLADLRFREEEVSIPNIEWIEESLAEII